MHLLVGFSLCQYVTLSLFVVTWLSASLLLYLGLPLYYSPSVCLCSSAPVILYLRCSALVCLSATASVCPSATHYGWDTFQTGIGWISRLPDELFEIRKVLWHRTGLVLHELDSTNFLGLVWEVWFGMVSMVIFASFYLCSLMSFLKSKKCSGTVQAMYYRNWIVQISSVWFGRFGLVWLVWWFLLAYISAPWWAFRNPKNALAPYRPCTTGTE